MNLWMNAKGYHENILSTKLKEIGIGVGEKAGKGLATPDFFEK